MLYIGSTVEDYRILREIGRGSMGIVFEAEHLFDRTRVALKTIHATTNAHHHREAEDRLLTEAQAAARLNHPNIAKVLDIIHVNKSVYLVMELLAGESLDSVIKTRALDIDKAFDCVFQAARALSYAHAQGVSHRDIKPANMMLCKTGELKLVDFGIAKLNALEDFMVKGTLLGTAHYLSPERARGMGGDEQSDIWSLAVVLYELLTETLPFFSPEDNSLPNVLLRIATAEPEPVSHWIVGDSVLLKKLDSFFQKALAKHKPDRFQDISAFLQTLQGIIPEHLAEPLAEHLKSETGTSISNPLKPRPLTASDLKPSSDSRRRERSLIEAYLQHPDSKVLSVLGQGGVGKSQLAGEIARQEAITSYFADGVYLVNVEHISAPLALAATCVEAMGQTLQSPRDPMGQLVGLINEQHLLLIIDNFEHLMGGALEFQRLIDGCPHVKLLFTSRFSVEALEAWQVPISGLSCSGGIHSQAAQLFLDVTQKKHSDFPAEEQAAIVSLLELLEGLPLGIRLAAAWLNIYSPSDILQNVANNFEFLHSHSEDTGRHLSLAAVFESSWRLLPEEEVQALANLAIFTTPFHQKASSFVARVDGSLLKRLEQKSLVKQIDDGFYQIPKILRDFIVAKVGIRTGDYHLLQRYNTYFFLRLQRYFTLLRTSKEQFIHKDIGLHLDDFKNAWFNLSSQDISDQGFMEMTRTLEHFFHIQGRSLEGIAFFEDNLTDNALLSPSKKRHIELSLAWLYVQVAEYGKAQALLHQQTGREDQRQANGVILYRHLIQGTVYAYQGNFDEACDAYSQALALAQQRQAPELSSIASNLGAVKAMLGSDDAIHYLNLAVEHADKQGFESLAVSNLNNLSSYLIEKKRFDEAEAHALKAHNLAIRLNNKRFLPLIEGNLGEIYFAQKRFDKSESYIMQALERAKNNTDTMLGSLLLATLGRLKAHQQDFSTATRCFHQSLKHSHQLSSSSFSVLQNLTYLCEALYLKGRLSVALSLGLVLERQKGLRGEDLEVVRELIGEISSRLDRQPIHNITKISQALDVAYFVEKFLGLSLQEPSEKDS